MTVIAKAVRMIGFCLVCAFGISVWLVGLVPGHWLCPGLLLFVDAVVLTLVVAVVLALVVTVEIAHKVTVVVIFQKLGMHMSTSPFNMVVNDQFAASNVTVLHIELFLLWFFVHWLLICGLFFSFRLMVRGLVMGVH